LITAAVLLGCGGEPPGPDADPAAPNVLFVVWDTVRADHLSLYGYPRPTTPRLEAWAENARVFENARATASSTVPTHASLFTGLLPSEHGAHADHPYLDDRFTTLAERFQNAGYRTYLWASNPHISQAKNFTQGFDRAEHPWSPGIREEALRVVRAKVPPEDRSSALREKLERADPGDWVLSAAGSLAARHAADFAAGDPNRPWLVFLNYMEAHRPYVPPVEYRRHLMDEAGVQRSYTLDRSWPAVWAHTFGIRRYPPEDLRVIAATYDAALRELDDLFAELLETFDERGLLERDTVVVLTADHGELLGEHGLLDHQYSLYQPLVRVPLVLHAPGRVEPGVSSAPVLAMDVYPTLLELAGIATPGGPPSLARSLLSPAADRARLAEYPAIFQRPLRTARKLAPGVDLDGWQRRLRAYERDGWKLIEGEDGRHELYDLRADPDETRDRAASDPEQRDALREGLYELARELQRAGTPEPIEREIGGEEARLLEELGYAEPGPTPSQLPARADTSWSLTD
jgi:arylsulfatase A-like enzyme